MEAPEYINYNLKKIDAALDLFQGVFSLKNSKWLEEHDLLAANQKTREIFNEIQKLEQMVKSTAAALPL